MFIHSKGNKNDFKNARFLSSSFCIINITMDYFFVFFNRLDISSVQGQSSRLSCILRGTHASRLVQCYSSHPTELQVSTYIYLQIMRNWYTKYKRSHYYKGTWMYDLFQQNPISSKNSLISFEISLICNCCCLWMFSCCCRWRGDCYFKYCITFAGWTIRSFHADGKLSPRS